MINGYKIISKISSTDELMEVAKDYGDVVYQQDDLNKLGSVEISTRLQINKYAYKNQALFPHTDRSSEIIPPKFVMIWYEKMANFGGEPLIVETDQILNNCEEELKDFKAHFSSENDGLSNIYSFYDTNQNIFRFRNDSHIYIPVTEIDKFKKLKETIQKNQITLQIKDKDCLIINNWSVLHGRNAFLGDRIIHRVLIK